MPVSIKSILARDYDRYDGVRRINVYLLRVLYLLMATLLAKDVWTYIIAHQGPWNSDEAMAFSVWAGFSTLAILGVFHPVKMIPILLLEIFYKSLWLILVAYPLWQARKLAGSPAAGETYVFLPVIVVILIIPWGYVFRTYVIDIKKRSKSN